MAERRAAKKHDVHDSIVQAARKTGTGHRQIRHAASEAFSRYDVDGSGELNDMEVRQVVRDMTGRAPTSEQMHFLKTELDADGDAVITKAEFTRWYVKYVIGEQGQTLNRLLVRDQVGHPRPSTYKLPPPDQAFGVKNPADSYGTRDAVTYWDAPKVQRQRAAPVGPDLTNRVFGVVNARTDAPMRNVMAHGYGAQPAKEDVMPAGTQHARTMAPKVPASALASGATISSALRTTAAREKIRAQQDQGPGWKLSKFERQAHARMTSHARNPAGSNPAYAEMKRRKAELAAARAKGGMRYADKVRARHARQAAAAAEGKAEYGGEVPADMPQVDMSAMPHE